MTRSIAFFFFFNDTATTEIYTLSLHDALPIWPGRRRPRRPAPGRAGLRQGAQGAGRALRRPRTTGARRLAPGRSARARAAGIGPRALPRGAGTAARPARRAEPRARQDRPGTRSPGPATARAPAHRRQTG